MSERMAENNALEAALDEVGRERAFSRARALGWNYGPPPRFVWWGIVQQLREEDQPND